MNTKNFKNKRIKDNQQGFSLIEMLVALAIFTMVIGGVTLFSVRTIQSHTRSQAMQTAIENAQFAIEGLNKKIRTSHKIDSQQEWSSGSSDWIYVEDNVDLVKYCYAFRDNKLRIKSGVANSSACTTSSGWSDLVGGDGKTRATGRFYVKESDELSGAPSARKRGMVATVISIEYNPNPVTSDPYQKNSFTIQSTVSLRDYGMN